MVWRWVGRKGIFGGEDLSLPASGESTFAAVRASTSATGVARAKAARPRKLRTNVAFMVDFRFGFCGFESVLLVLDELMVSSEGAIMRALYFFPRPSRRVSLLFSSLSFTPRSVTARVCLVILYFVDYEAPFLTI